MINLEKNEKSMTLKSIIPSILVCLAWQAAAPTMAMPPPGNDTAAEAPRKGGVIILPIVFYSPETKLAGGLGGLLTFRGSRAGAAGRPSSIYFYAIYTQLKQFSISWEPEFYFQKEAWLVKGRLLVERYPDRFWGIGPAASEAAEEGYTPRSVMLEASFQRKVVPAANLYAGFQIRYERYRIVKADPVGIIGRGAIAGSGGGTGIGIGFVLNRDSRDDVFFPRRGDYWLLSAVFNARAIGGDFAYTHVKLDVRKYLPVGSTRVLAFQGQVQVITGMPPFYGYAKLGGDTMMRGYYIGRYRDKVMAAAQAEYRMPLFWRIGIVGFAGLGNVAPRFGALELGCLKYFYGTGLRFRVSSQEATNIRVDLAFGKGTSGVYFTAREAF
jgi:outer membrane protein assembly factor BamA